MRRSLVALVALQALLVVLPLRAEAPKKASLYDRLGGTEGLTLVVKDWRKRNGEDKRISARLENVNSARVGQNLLDFLIQTTGGPLVYKGLAMKPVHAGMGLSDAEFDAFLGNLAASFEGRGVPAAEIAEVLALLEPMRRDVVERAPGLDARLAALEARLSRIERRLDRVLDRMESTESAPTTAPATGKSEGPTAEEAARVVVDLAAARSDPPPAWSASEKELSARLLTRLKTAEGKAGHDEGLDLVGRPLEQTRFISQTGELFDLKDFRGKRIVLVILRGFSGAICLHCSVQTMALADAVDQFKDKGAEIFLVYPGQASSVPQFIAAVRNLREGFTPPFKILLDVDLLAVKSFRIEGSLAKPTTLILDEKGIVRWAYVGRQPADRPTVPEMLDALARMPRGKSR